MNCSYGSLEVFVAVRLSLGRPYGLKAKPGWLVSGGVDNTAYEVLQASRRAAPGTRISLSWTLPQQCACEVA